MKNMTTIFAFMAMFLCVHSQQSYSELNTPGIEIQTQAIPGKLKIILHNDNGRLPVLETYDERADFENAYDADCVIPLISENFSGGPGGITTCGPVVSSNGDDCFAAGSLEEGFEVTAMGTGGNLVVFIPAGAVGNTSDLVGANSFSDYTILSFTNEDVYAIGHDVFNNTSLEADYRIFDANGDLLASYTLMATASVSENFFGFISDEPIGRIEIEGAAEDGELFGNLVFGVCNALSVNDNLIPTVSVYPNPTTGELRLNVSNGFQISGVTLYDLQGKDMRVSYSNGTVDISNLSRGVYMLTIKTSEGTLTQKVVKK